MIFVTENDLDDTKNTFAPPHMTCFSKLARAKRREDVYFFGARTSVSFGLSSSAIKNMLCITHTHTHTQKERETHKRVCMHEYLRARNNTYALRTSISFGLSSSALKNMFSAPM
jgi:hypothetical protein